GGARCGAVVRSRAGGAACWLCLSHAGRFSRPGEGGVLWPWASPPAALPPAPPYQRHTHMPRPSPWERRHNPVHRLLQVLETFAASLIRFPGRTTSGISEEVGVQRAPVFMG